MEWQKLFWPKVENLVFELEYLSQHVQKNNSSWSTVLFKNDFPGICEWQKKDILLPYNSVVMMSGQ